jgi:glutaredoxin
MKLQDTKMYDVYGTDWCCACTAVKKELTSRGLPYTFTTLPAGPRGWEAAEELSGKRALPVVMINGTVVGFQEFLAEIRRFPAKELTQEQLDRIEP